MYFGYTTNLAHFPFISFPTLLSQIHANHSKYIQIHVSNVIHMYLGYMTISLVPLSFSLFILMYLVAKIHVSSSINNRKLLNSCEIHNILKVWTINYTICNYVVKLKKLPQNELISPSLIFTLVGYSTKEGLWRLWGKIWLFMVMVVNTTIDVYMFIITIMFLKDTKTPISAPPDYESNKARRIVHRIISLDDLKFVKNAMNVVSYNKAKLSWLIFL